MIKLSRFVGVFRVYGCILTEGGAGGLSGKCSSSSWMRSDTADAEFCVSGELWLLKFLSLPVNHRF